MKAEITHRWGGHRGRATEWEITSSDAWLHEVAPRLPTVLGAWTPFQSSEDQTPVAYDGYAVWIILDEGNTEDLAFEIARARSFVRTNPAWSRRSARSRHRCTRRRGRSAVVTRYDRWMTDDERTLCDELARELVDHGRRLLEAHGQAIPNECINGGYQREPGTYLRRYRAEGIEVMHTGPEKAVSEWPHCFFVSSRGSLLARVINTAPAELEGHLDQAQEALVKLKAMVEILDGAKTTGGAS